MSARTRRAAGAAKKPISATKPSPSDAHARVAALLEPGKVRGPAGIAKAAAALRDARHSGEAVADARFAAVCVRVFSLFPDERPRHPEAKGTLENEAAQLLLAARWR